MKKPRTAKPPVNTPAADGDVSIAPTEPAAQEAAPLESTAALTTAADPTTDAALAEAAPLESTAADPTTDTALAEAAPIEATDEAVPAAASTSRRSVRRFAVAFLFGLLAVLTVSAGALAAYESSNTGRILAGVHVGTVDLSGLTPSAAAARLREAYASLGTGELVLSAAGSDRIVSFADLGRRIDADAIVTVAMGIGRDGPAIERIASNVRMFVRGLEIEPGVVLERAALRHEIAALSSKVALIPTNATVDVGEVGFALTPSVDGRIADIEATLLAAEALLTDPTTPSSVSVSLPITVVEPDVTSAEATAARDAADRMAADTQLIDGAHEWTITAAQFRSWISFDQTPDGGYGPILARDGIEAALSPIAGDVAVAPVDATFLLGDGKKVVGVTNAKDGRALDVPGTVDALVNAVQQRIEGLSVSRVPISVTTVEPDFTTAEATETAPLMQPVSEWTTIFPISIANGAGVNIWIPARKIDGTVLQPGEWFDFWKAISPVTREAGYKDGGAIINGKTEPQGALAGGICSCSTTLFNAALRAGLEMGARRNHYYYISRYPLGLDATVFSSSSGSTQTMSFRNDTASPILIRGTGWSVGSKGYVKFVIWSAPTGRTVKLSTPIVKNVLAPSDTTVYTTSLPPGQKLRIEYPAAGKDVWVTRTVTDATGAVVHTETYYSHYARITGILQIGVAPTPTPIPEPTPEPTPIPAP